VTVPGERIGKHRVVLRNQFRHWYCHCLLTPKSFA
jgi:hypothetical protein